MRRSLRIVTPGFVALSAGSALAAAPGDHYGHPMMWGGAGWMMLLGPLMMLLLLAGIVVLVVLGIRWLISSGHMPGGSAPSPGPRPLDILKERLARGEIEVAEYEERRRALGDG